MAQNESNQDQQGWEMATYEGVERQQLIDGMRMSLGDKLEWLEYAQGLVERMQKSRTTPAQEDSR